MKVIKSLLFHNYKKSLDRGDYAIRIALNFALSALSIMVTLISFALSSNLEYYSISCLLGGLGTIFFILLMINSFRLSLSRSLDIFGITKLKSTFEERGIMPFITAIIMLMVPMPIGIIGLILLPTGFLKKYAN
jgi:hypothetical protein